MRPRSEEHEVRLGSAGGANVRQQLRARPLQVYLHSGRGRVFHVGPSDPLIDLLGHYHHRLGFIIPTPHPLLTPSTPLQLQ